MCVDEITFFKRSPKITDRPKILNLMKQGAKLCVDANQKKKFLEIGVEPTLDAEEGIERATVVIDCTPVGNENKEKYFLKHKDKIKGFIAQGSEFGFGKPYARGVNDEALDPKEDQFLQVVSCNTHNLAVLIKTIALADGEDNLEEARFVCIRRANDISQDDKFTPSPQVGKHDDEIFGTHHARDAFHLFKTLGLDLNLFSSALKLNTQYMHTIQFNLKLKKPTTKEILFRRLEDNPRIAVTHKRSANLVFSFGRDYGHYGRILNETVIALPTLLIRNGNEVTGFCFTPQDGNSLLSSFTAAAWFLDPDKYTTKIQGLMEYMFEEV
jgi:glyceraldehyde-3-phosphate dehydrogenase (NAD(P))